jgi:hypothetical protein
VRPLSALATVIVGVFLLLVGCGEDDGATPAVCTVQPASAALCSTYCGGGADKTDAPPPDARNNTGNAPSGERRNGCLAPGDVDPADGVASIPDGESFVVLSMPFPHETLPELDDVWYLNFIINDVAGTDPWLYFVNTRRHGPHWSFTQAIGCDSDYSDDRIVGALFYRPAVVGPTGDIGTYLFDIESHKVVYEYDTVAAAYEVLVGGMPSLTANLGYLPLSADQKAQVAADAVLYEDAPFDVHQVAELPTQSGFQALNQGEAFGRLRVMELNEIPSAQDLVIYAALPNELPRVAGVITSVPQTPMSHVNLRAIQDGVPNAFIEKAQQHASIAPLIGTYVFYRVKSTGFEIREATDAEVDAYFGGLRPSEPQVPVRDLSVQSIMALDEIGFSDSAAFGVKAANVAEMRRFGFPAGTVPDGAALPFYFYDEFMKHNELYKAVDGLVKTMSSTADRTVRMKLMADFRKVVKGGEMPSWMMEALESAHATFPPGTSVRCRSSTNNEDLPGYSGAGLYESYTHHPHEGHLAKSIRQVFAGMWTLRAFESREFYRVDHHAAAMGVLMHPNYSDEQVNGVALSGDVLYGFDNFLYVNSQVGEDLVTNPQDYSFPEEMLIKQEGQKYHIVRFASGADGDEPLMSEDQIFQLRDSLKTIHSRFEKLYQPGEGEPFLMEIEFKITAEGILAIKQARPWVFNNGITQWSDDVCACRCP